MPRRAQRQSVFLPPGIERYVIHTRELKGLPPAPFPAIKQRGGYVYGKGSFGCVVSHKSRCLLRPGPNAFREDPNKTYVYKLLTDHESYQNEVHIGEKLARQLEDGMELYTPVILEACEVVIDQTAAQECRIDPNTHNIYQIIYEYLGKDIFYHIHEAPSRYRPSFKTLIRSCKNIVDFINVLSVNNWTHGDLRIENTLYDKDKGARVIDLGLAQSIDTVFNDPMSSRYIDYVIRQYSKDDWLNYDVHGSWYCPEKTIAHLAYKCLAENRLMTVEDLNMCAKNYYHKLHTISADFVKTIYKRDPYEFFPLAWAKIVGQFIELSDYKGTRYSKDWKNYQDTMKKIPLTLGVDPALVLDKLRYDVSHGSSDDAKYLRDSMIYGKSVNKYDIFSVGMFFADIYFGMKSNRNITAEEDAWAQKWLLPIIREACQPTLAARMTIDELHVQFNEGLIHLPEPRASSPRMSALQTGRVSQYKRRATEAAHRTKIIDSDAPLALSKSGSV